MSNDMTNQEAFDIVLRELRKQGRASVADAGGGPGIDCRYRGLDGLKCAAGHLLPDSEYDDKFEGDAVSVIEFFKTLGPSESLLERLQEAHDTELARLGVEAWELRMSRIACRHGLEYAPPARAAE